MSYNIDSCDVLVNGKLRIKAKDVERFLSDEFDADMPEGSFLDDLVDKLPDARGYVPIDGLLWHGEGSGRAYETLKQHVLPATKGYAEVVYYWEGGDSVTGLMVRDGVVTECEVETRLVKP